MKEWLDLWSEADFTVLPKFPLLLMDVPKITVEKEMTNKEKEPSS